MKKWPLLMLLSLWLPALTQSQTSDSLKADALVKASMACLQNGNTDSAAICLKQGLAIFQKNNFRLAWLQSHVKSAYVWAGSLDHPFVGLDLVETALQTYPWTPNTWAEWEQICLTHLAKAFMYEEYANDFLSAKREYEAGFQVFLSKLNEKSDRVAGYLFYKYGNLCTRLGDYERAQNLLQRGIDYGEKYNLPGVAKYGDLAIALLDLKKTDQAFAVIQKGLAHQGSSAEALNTLRRSEARAYLVMGNYPASRRAASEIPPLIKRLKLEGGRTDPAYYWSGYYETLAELADVTGDFNQSIANYKRAIQYETESWGTQNRREVGKLFWQLGDLYLQHNQPQAALAEFQQVLRCVLPSFLPANASENPTDRSFYAENTILEALEGKAKAFRALGQLEKALECYELMPTVETKLRATHAYESSSLLALDESRKRFDVAISIAWDLYENSNGDRQYAERAFQLTEQARGMLLLQSLAQAQANYQLPQDVRQRENQLAVKIAWYDHEIAAEREAGANGDKARLARLEKEQFDLKQENEKFKSDLRQNFPDYAALSDEIHFLQAREVSSLLELGQVMVDYYLTDQNAFVFSFDVKGNFYWRKAVLPTNFRESVLQLVNYMQKGDEEDKFAAQSFRSMASSLYELLLGPDLNRVLPQSGRLIIVPDDALVFVPFEALLRKPVTSGNWRDLPWVLNDYSTGYAYSATLLQMQQTISSKHREQQEPLQYGFGGYAPSYSTKGMKLTSTQTLVNGAHGLLGGKTWCGQQASEEGFKASAPNCRILLLAMHGLADAENPELSRLLFGDPGPDSLENNNVLYASELQIMQLQADLAVLSACHSGFGKLQKGEGMFSLARAFARAGVPATVMSLWLLHENAAGPLVQGFLQYLQEGKTKDEALCLAKKDFLKNDQYFDMGHPFFWAGVTTAGDMCALSLEKPSVFSWKWLAGLVVAALAFWVIRRRKQKPEAFPA